MKSLNFCCIFFTIVGFQVYAAPAAPPEQCSPEQCHTELDLLTMDTLNQLERLARIPINEMEKNEFTNSVLDQTKLVVRGVLSKLRELYERLDKVDNKILPSQLKEIKNVIQEKLAYLKSDDMEHKLEEIGNIDVHNQVFYKLPKNIQTTLLDAGKEVNILLKKLLTKYNEMRPNGPK